MTKCLCGNVSLIFCFLKCCANMPRRNTSQRPPEEVTNDRLRCGRVQNSTSSARREKQAVLPPLAGRGRRGARDLVELMLRGDQRHRWVYPRRWTRRSISNIMRCISRHKIRLIMRSLNSIILMRINSISISLILSRSNQILSRSSLSSMKVGVMLSGCRGWSTRPDQTAMEAGPNGYESMPM